MDDWTADSSFGASRRDRGGVEDARPIDRFIPRDAVIGVGVAFCGWAVVMGLSATLCHAWLWPLAVIPGFVALPIGISGGILRRA